MVGGAEGLGFLHHVYVLISEGVEVRSTIEGKSRSGVASSVVREHNILQGKQWRITFLTESLFRYEWSDSGVFEDKPTSLAKNRNFAGAVDFSVEERSGWLSIRTEHLRVSYNRQAPSKEGFSVVVAGVSNSQANTWHYGDRPSGNLGGTARTLDEADGAIAIESGVISRDGWSVLDDSESMIFSDDDVMIHPRDHAETDLYFFGYGHRYIEAIRDFYRLSGNTPLLPRFAMGNWWSRFYPYTQDEYINLMDRFDAQGIPLTVSVIDMDWHLTDIDAKYGSGWTGYTWNKELFPDHVRFLDEVHHRGLRTTLNVHPRDGIRAFEQPYAAAAAVMGDDIAAGEDIEFDLTNPRFVEAYMGMHHDLEREGVDFWWIDWQQGGVTRQPGLDPLWALNRLHYHDAKDQGCTPLIFSRYAGPGSHRYPVGFSGDTIISWKSLRFQPYFTATASNIGYGWWSHDIGGHMLGYRDDVLEARWYQLGVFSPINRLHSSASAFSGKEPWNFSSQVRESMTQALRLRHRMIPYLYSMNYRASLEGRPIVEPMYWQSSEIAAAYEVPDEFRFGTQLLVAPVVTPDDAAAQAGATDVWFPEGRWFDCFDGRQYHAQGEHGASMRVWRTIDRIPVFAPAGGIVPMQRLEHCDQEHNARKRINDISNPEELDIMVFPAAAGSFTLCEDGGEPGIDVARTCLSLGVPQVAEGVGSFVIAPVEGEVRSVPGCRTWNITVRGVGRPQDPCRISVGGVAAACDAAYDERTLSYTVTVRNVDVMQRVVVDFPADMRVAENPVQEDAYEVLLRAQMPFEVKDKAFAAVKRLGVGALSTLQALTEPSGTPKTATHVGKGADGSLGVMPMTVFSELMEIMTRTDES